MKYSNKLEKQILANLGFDGLNLMQQKTTEASRKHKDMLLLAPTGSGKTAAFLLSVLPRLKQKNGVQVLILAPTRELVLQIESVLKKMKLPLKVNACYGGHPFSVERKNFSTPPTILVGTPGRIKDHLERDTFDPSTITQLVFDEFDKSLEFGFKRQMEAITKFLPNVAYKFLASATKAIDIPRFLNMKDPHTIDFSRDLKKVDLTIQQIVVPKEDKPEALVRIVDSLQPEQNAIIFVNHKEAANRIGEVFKNNDIIYAVFHGGLEQPKRELELTKFRNGSTQILVATDIAARGIDIPDLDFVIHYQLPHTESQFIHRNGRTARMKASGTSILIRTETDYLPRFLDDEPETFPIAMNAELAPPQWVTLHINRGKKDKVNKIDIVGFFLQFEFMNKEDLGLIEVKDYFAM